MFQEFPARQSAVAGAPGSTAREEAAALIDRYPNVSETELARLINLYRGFSALDSALIVSDDRLGPKLDNFYADHRSKLRLPLRQYAGLVAYAMLAVIAVAWAVAVAS
jgi:hypothetical protein